MALWFREGQYDVTMISHGSVPSVNCPIKTIPQTCIDIGACMFTVVPVINWLINADYFCELMNDLFYKMAEMEENPPQSVNCMLQH